MIKLDRTITLHYAKYVEANEVKQPPSYTTDELKIIYLDNPELKQYYLSIYGLPNPTMLFEGEEYHLDITKEMANQKLLELSKGDMQTYLQNQIPKSLEDEPYAPGSILASMFGAIGIKSSPTCSCRRHALEMNERGIEWCEANIDTILGWLKEECEKRKIPWVETVARLVVNKAISKSKKYRAEQNAQA